jgi:hypothetical protein
MTYHVPGVSIAVIHHSAIEWAQGFGVAQVGGGPVSIPPGWAALLSYRYPARI